jgi:cohesin loading factor subunit SCC2
VEESESSEEEDEEDAEEGVDKKLDPVLKAKAYRMTEVRKEHPYTKIGPSDPTTKKSASLASHNDATAARLIVKNLSSERPLFNSFDFYHKQNPNVLGESSIQVRSEALKCKELIDKYYEMLLLRILDTGVSVKKRVIKILKDICLGLPDYPWIPDICVKMIRRINDEEGIRKLVMDVYQNMGFQPRSKRRRSAKEEHQLVTRRRRTSTWWRLGMTPASSGSSSCCRPSSSPRRTRMTPPR